MNRQQTLQPSPPNSIGGSGIEKAGTTYPIPRREGVSVYDVAGGGLATIEEYETTRLLLEQDFEKFPDVTWHAFERMTQERGWTGLHLRRAWEWVLEHKSSYVQTGDTKPRISIGDLFRAPSPTVYGRDWYKNQVTLDPQNSKRIGIYTLGNRLVFGWRKELDPWTEVEGSPLRWYQPPQRKQLPAPASDAEPMDAATRRMWEKERKYLERWHYVQHLEKRRDELQGQIDKQDETIRLILDDLQAVIEERDALYEQCKVYYAQLLEHHIEPHKENDHEPTTTDPSTDDCTDGTGRQADKHDQQ